MRRVFQWLVALAAFGIPMSAVGDDLEDFAVAPADFVASVSQGATAVQGHRLFVAGVGTTLSAISHDAVIVAVDTRRATEVWRAIAGEAGRGDSFDAVAASGGRVCAVGRGMEFLVTTVMLVACYKAATGKLLWEREFPTPGLRTIINAFSMRLSGRTLVVTINDPFTPVPRVLLFDAQDGS